MDCGRASPYSSTAAIPALNRSHLNGASSASRTDSVASTISGPIPSPSIRVAGIAFLIFIILYIVS